MVRPLHILVYSDPGGGKTTFLATLPKPMLVLMWDPFGKEMPYLRAGAAEPLTDLHGIPTQRVMSRRDPNRLLIQIEHYIDVDVRTANAYQSYLARMARFDANNESGQWASVVSDGTTYMELAARKNAQYRLNAGAKDPRQWYGASTDTLEEQLMLRFGSMQCNVGISCHIDDSRVDIHGNAIRVPNAPGRLRRHLGSAYTELYYLHVRVDEDAGITKRVLQVHQDEEWAAMTSIQGLGMFVEPHYKYLKAAMEAEGQ